MRKLKTNRGRTTTGSGLAEFGPALGLLLIGFFFPMINFCALFTGYATCMMLNGAQCREAALLTKQQAQDKEGTIRKGIPQYWTRSGLGQFAAIVGSPKTDVTYNGTTPEVVHVKTTCSVLPWLIIPLPVDVPGMNAPTSFSIDGYAPVERKTEV